MTYPDKTGFVRHSETSAASARALDESGRAGTYDSIIMARLMALGTEGATAEEMRKDLNIRFPHVHNGSVNGRMSTLWRRREIVKTTGKRKTDSGKDAHVYVHHVYRSSVEAMPEYAQVADDSEALREMVQIMLQNLQSKPDSSGVIHLTPLDMSLINRLSQRAGLTKEGRRP